MTIPITYWSSRHGMITVYDVDKRIAVTGFREFTSVNKSVSAFTRAANFSIWIRRSTPRGKAILVGSEERIANKFADVYWIVVSRWVNEFRAEQAFATHWHGEKIAGSSPEPPLYPGWLVIPR